MTESKEVCRLSSPFMASSGPSLAGRDSWPRPAGKSRVPGAIKRGFYLVDLSAWLLYQNSAGRAKFQKCRHLDE